MSLAAALLLAAAAAQATPAHTTPAPDHGAQFDTAQVSAHILQPAVLKNGVLLSDPHVVALHNQKQSRDGRVTYLFE